MLIFLIKYIKAFQVEFVISKKLHKGKAPLQIYFEMAEKKSTFKKSLNFFEKRINKRVEKRVKSPHFLTRAILENIVCYAPFDKNNLVIIVIKSYLLDELKTFWSF